MENGGVGEVVTAMKVVFSSVSEALARNTGQSGRLPRNAEFLRLRTYDSFSASVSHRTTDTLGRRGIYSSTWTCSRRSRTVDTVSAHD